MDGPNLYEYVRGRPVTLSDPSGRISNDDRMKMLQSWMEVGPDTDVKTKYMLRKLKELDVEMYVRNSWLYNYDGEKDYIWIDCDYNGLIEATGWYEDGMREWARNNDAKYRQIVRDYALDHGGDTVKVLADTFDFAHKWTRHESKDPSDDMPRGIGGTVLWVFVGSSTVSSAANNPDDPVSTTDHGNMSRYYYDMTGGLLENNHDQTHHYAAYFALGTTMKYEWLARLALDLSNDSPSGNPGDYLLGVAGIKHGISYHWNPRYMGPEITRMLENDPVVGATSDAGWEQAVLNASFILGDRSLDVPNGGV